MPHADIRAALSHWPLIAAGAKITNVTPGFSGASVYLIITAGGGFAIRCWPSGNSGLPRARIEELHRWLASLAAAGVTTVAVPLRTDSGTTLVEERNKLWQ